ncbi:hypothetical protein GRF29_19g3196754 [Pseudopithomyces chartarum]|uniref:Uncharacterized protein n=1 Tax=Pseudopithomyces chartarum TaxID=1892770 RepID=A0AAN6M6Y6_9PLEO|nr:hypothetical protein GRF29_19g3196754 [Pseudopithomyces chartarum]
MPPIFNALIRTHHITSRKKVAKLRAAASNYNIYALLRYGGCPGIMYCQGTESGPGEKMPEGPETDATYGKAEEVESVKDFGAKMQELGVWAWWRKGMGYLGDG